MFFKKCSCLKHEDFSSCRSPKATTLQSLPIICACFGTGTLLEMITRVKEDCVDHRYKCEAIYIRSLNSTNLQIDQSQAVNAPRTLKANCNCFIPPPTADQKPVIEENSRAPGKFTGQSGEPLLPSLMPNTSNISSAQIFLETGALRNLILHPPRESLRAVPIPAPEVESQQLAAHCCAALAPPYSLGKLGTKIECRSPSPLMAHELEAGGLWVISLDLLGQGWDYQNQNFEL